MKKFSLFAVASLLLLATGCSESDNLGTEPNNAIEFRSVVDKSRASLVDQTADLESFFVKGMQVSSGAQSDFMSASVYYDGLAWTYSPKKYWPTNGDVVNFYAFAPYSSAVENTLVADGASAKFSYTVPNNQSVSNTAVDLLVAKVIGATTGPVAFQFTHALSAATFSAKNSNPIGSELVYTISKIEITTLKNNGTYNYAAGTWTASGANVVYVAGLPASGVAVQPDPNSTVKLLSDNDLMMMLPQTSDAATKVLVTYSLKDGEGKSIYTDKVKELSFASQTLAPGTRYNFTFSFDVSNAITFTVDVAGWTDTTI